MMTSSTQRQTIAIQQNTMAQQQNNAAKSQQGSGGGWSGGGAGWGGIIMGVVGIVSQIWAAEERKKSDPDYEPAGFANGGNFTVGGSGGTDSQNVAFRATPGEEVTIETPSQKRRRQQQENQMNSPVNVEPTPVIINNLTDPSVIGELLATSEGENQFLNYIRRNQTQVNEALRS